MKCRNCNNTKLTILFKLKDIAMTGKFYLKKIKNKDSLTLLICNKCSLVQLKNNFNLKYLFNSNYGYSSGLNSSMKLNLKGIAKDASDIIQLRNKNIVLGIASNDGTLLNYYSEKLIKVGIDPILTKFKKNYKNINYAIPDFFSSKKYFSKVQNKAKIITVLSMFYDVPRPNIFLKDIKKILHDDGILILEQSDLSLMLKNNSIDTICHEHIMYYSISVINSMMLKNGLKIFKHQFNNINGGSSRFFITHIENKKFKTPKSFYKKLRNEKNFALHKKITFNKFIQRIDNNKIKLLNILKKIKSQNKTVHCLGASTKGNLTLQYFGIDNTLIDFVAEVNPDKFNKLTPGSNIKIIPEEMSKKMKPDYYLVLPWHFKKNLIEKFRKEKKYIGKFIFPFPNVSIVNIN